MKITELMETWKTDSKFDILHISEELAKIPELHQKYLNEMVTANLIMKNLIIQYNKLKHKKRQYFSNELDIEEIQDLNWPVLDKLILKTNIESHLLADDDLNKIQSKIDIQNEIVDYCKYVLKEINNRSFQVRALIDYKKYEAGY